METSSWYGIRRIPVAILVAFASSPAVQAGNDEVRIWAGEDAKATRMGGRRKEKAMRDPPREGGSKSQNRVEIGGKVSLLWFSWSKEEVNVFYATVCLCVSPPLQLAATF